MLRIKRGDTFAFFANMTDESGDPLITDVANIKSQIRDASDNLISDLSVATTETSGTYLFTASSTDNWPTELWGDTRLLMDIEINIEGQVNSSDTIDVMVAKDVTRVE